MSKALATASKETSFKQYLQSAPIRNAIARALPKHMRPEKIISAALVAMQLQPKLMECDNTSVIRSIVVASQLGLEPGGALGSAYLVPYGRTCQLIPGYRGMIDLARRSGAVSGVEARVVYDCDRFDLEYGTNSRVEHVPALERTADAKFVGAYCVVKIKDGDPLIEWMSRSEIERIRAGSKAGRSGPWVDHFDEMARKTVVRRALKYAPLTTELASAMQIDEQAERGEEQHADSLEPLDLGEAEDQSRAEALEAEFAAAEDGGDA